MFRLAPALLLPGSCLQRSEDKPSDFFAANADRRLIRGAPRPSLMLKPNMLTLEHRGCSHDACGYLKPAFCCCIIVQRNPPDLG